MSETRLKFNTKAWEEIRKSAAVRANLLARAGRAKEAADKWAGKPDSFKVVQEPGKHRARFTVRPNTFAAVRKVARNPTEFANICIQAGKG